MAKTNDTTRKSRLVGCEDVGDAATVWITSQGWARVLELGCELTLLDVAENLGQAGLSAWLTDHQIQHRKV